MPKKAGYVPKYCLHKPKGRAYMRVNGKVVYLGDYDSPESHEAYGRILAEMAVSPNKVPDPQAIAGLTITELIALYWDHAQAYYQKDGKPSQYLHSIRIALKRLKTLYGDTLATEFSPRALKALRQIVIDAGCCRRYVNKQVDLIRLMFKWAVSEELIPVAVFQALTTVTGLRKGRSNAKDNKPVGPIADAVVEATIPYLPPVISDMVKLQRRSGMRPGEICQLRPVDLERSGAVWEYRPASHKTQHHDKERVIFLGPKAQSILLPYLLRAGDAHCFSPAESTQKRLEAKRAKRKTKVQPSQYNRRKRRPKRKPGTSYERHAYGNAIRRAIIKANRERAKQNLDLLPIWRANQLRHAAGTQIRKEFDLESARTVLGHTKASTTEIYAEQDRQKAIEVVRTIG
jgi:integrase